MSSHSNIKLILTSQMWIFEKSSTYLEHLISKQYIETDSLISEDFGFEVVF